MRVSIPKRLTSKQSAVITWKPSAHMRMVVNAIQSHDCNTNTRCELPAFYSTDIVLMEQQVVVSAASPHLSFSALLHTQVFQTSL